MTNKELMYIITAYNKGSFSHAAQALFISQSALSQSIRKIEQELGMELFTYMGNRIVPTDACVHLVNSGQPLLDAWKEFEREMALYAENLQSQLVVGMNSFMTKYFRPYISEEYSKRFPNVNVRFVEEHSGDLYDLVSKRALDLCVIRRSAPSPNLIVDPMFSTQLLLAVPKEHPFAKAHPYQGLDSLEEVSLTEFRDDPFVVMKASRISELFDALFQEAGFTPNIYTDSYIWENLKDHVRSGRGLTFLDEMMVSRYPEDDYISYYRLKSNSKHYQLSVAYRPYNHMPPHVKGFIDVIKEYSQYLVPDSEDLSHS